MPTRRLAAALSLLLLAATVPACTAEDLAALRTSAASLEAQVESGRETLGTLTLERDAIAAELEALDARLEAAGLTPEERAEARAAAEAGAAELEALGGRISALAADVDRGAAVLQATLGRLATAESSEDVGGAVIDGIVTGGSILAPQYAALLGLGGTLLTAIWGGVERRRRRAADEATAKIVRSVEGAKLPAGDGEIRIDADRLAALQDAAGVRERVAAARAKA